MERRCASVTGVTWLCVVCAAAAVISAPVLQNQKEETSRRGKTCSKTLNRGERWIYNGKIGYIPYFIGYNSAGLDAAFEAARQQLESSACIRFVNINISNKAKMPPHLKFYLDSQSSAPVGMYPKTKEHPIKINNNIDSNSKLFHREVLHELGHAVGLRHEFSRSDRDDFVNIIGNVEDEKFCKYEGDDLFNHLPFDYISITNYGFQSGDKTIIQRKDTLENLSHTFQLSDCDKLKLYLLYPPTEENAGWCHDRVPPVCRKPATQDTTPAPGSSNPENIPSSASQPTSFIKGLSNAFWTFTRSKLRNPPKIPRPSIFRG